MTFEKNKTYIFNFGLSIGAFGDWQIERKCHNKLFSCSGSKSVPEKALLIRKLCSTCSKKENLITSALKLPFSVQPLKELSEDYCYCRMLLINRSLRSIRDKDY